MEPPVTDTTHGVGLIGRVVQEHRRTVYLLIAAFIGNVLLYAFVVYPLARRVANVEQSTMAAERTLAAARAEHSKANGTFTGKERASKELATFYSTVLAQDMTGARRLTYGRMRRLAEQSHLTYDRASYEPVTERGSNLTKFKVNMELEGNWADIRTFIHTIETAPEFIVIDNVELSEASAGRGSLRVTVVLSTYFRNAAQ
jgi:Tfp pilus assembly protein PilO